MQQGTLTSVVTARVSYICWLLFHPLDWTTGPYGIWNRCGSCQVNNYNLYMDQVLAGFGCMLLYFMPRLYQKRSQKPGEGMEGMPSDRSPSWHFAQCHVCNVL